MLRRGADIGFDVGTSNIAVVMKGRQPPLLEPAVIAFSTRTGALLAVGQEAKPMAHRDLPDVSVVRPVSGGVIADFDAAVELFRELFTKAMGRRRLMGPHVVATITSGATQVERYTLIQALLKAGARHVSLVDICLADYLASLSASNPTATRMVVDTGGGCTDIGIVSGGTVITSRSLRFGGNDLDEGVRRHVRSRFGLLIPPSSAENIKLRVGSVSSELQKEQVTLDGVKVYGELFRSVSVPLDGVPELLARNVALIAGEIRWIVEETAQEHREGVAENGIALCGGTFLLRGIGPLLSQKLGMPVEPMDDPLECSARGLSRILDRPGRLKLDGRQFSLFD